MIMLNKPLILGPLRGGNLVTTVAEIFKNAGVPVNIWHTIMTLESSGNPNAEDGTGAVGLFQLQQGSGLGGSHSVAYLKDPINNATIAAASMGPVYKKGVEKGLVGINLMRYTAYNGGWPTMQGVGAVKTDPVVAAYDKRLVPQYGKSTGAMLVNPAGDADIASVTEDIKESVTGLPGRIAGGASYIVVILLVAGVGLYSFFNAFKVSGGVKKGE